ncbi:hypothetical protein [Rhizobium mesosinicum]|uniref:Uncharacterized protein n=1 Tax=Rhizobium mesosinicum TaxID=335017 RepID=A0ABS7GU46_9HYPH|nr:hypothetical protein [Rhizobium mesosinicum]MBW9053436.1 hypothetical protein [Rhizobium mesosinicum]
MIIATAETAIASSPRAVAPATALGQLRRAALEALIEELIALLDAADGDPDLEDNADDEPSLGSTAKCIGDDCLEDLELDDCDDEEGGDEEPSMGWSNPEGLRVQVPAEASQIQDFDFDEGEWSQGFDGSGTAIAKASLAAAVTPGVTPKRTVKKGDLLSH